MGVVPPKFGRRIDMGDSADVSLQHDVSSSSRDDLATGMDGGGFYGWTIVLASWYSTLPLVA